MTYSLLPWIVADIRAAETRHSATTVATIAPHKCLYHEAKTSLVPTKTFYQSIYGVQIFVVMQGPPSDS